MSKFNVGDAVVVNQWGEGDGALGIEENFPFTSTVTSVLGDEEYYVRNTTGKGEWWVYEDMLSPLISEVASEVKKEPVVSIWADHLGDISRALNILTDAMKAMNEGYHDSDLEFRLDGKIRAEIYGNPTGWVLAYDPDSESYMFQVEA